jgi:hypothetical protein
MTKLVYNFKPWGCEGEERKRDNKNSIYMGP